MNENEAAAEEQIPESGLESESGPQDGDAFLVVGLGASSGGVQALQKFFDNTPPDSGMAFVVVMHLSPDFESKLAQVLQVHTRMPVSQVTGPMKVLPDHVYVIPSNRHLVMEDGRLDLTNRQQPEGRRVAIDLFFRTLAASCGQRAVAVVLSGSDSDGVIGIKHIKEQGGITVVQDPVEAEYDGMPRAALATGMVDWVLPVSLMPDRLVALADNEKQMHVPPETLPRSEGGTEAVSTKQKEPAGGAVNARQVPSVTDEDALAEVLRFLRVQTGHDFSHYKRATVLRRVARRLQVNLLEDIPSYLEFLRSHPAEANALLYDLLINVTNFFRDAEAFQSLQSYIPQLFAGKEAGDTVRAWVCGCASGEEAYSIAILLREYAERLDAPPTIQVFATDIDGEAVQIARLGIYPAAIEADVSTERLGRFFVQDQGRYRIRKEIRDLVLFSTHDILKDSPFSRQDLVACRNLLIYLKPEAQEQVFDTFHFALRDSGLLFLGGSESLEDAHPLFAPLDKRHHIYVRRLGRVPAGSFPWCRPLRILHVRRCFL